MLIYVWASLVGLGVFLGLSLFLYAAEKVLVQIGSCVITVNHGEQQFEEQGGTTLLNLLTDHKINVPSACAGKGTCGYCKVKVSEGGGPVLPTEVPYLSRSEKKGNVRLACQVKVRNDISVQIPDFLTVIKEIVKNRTYDSTKKWRFIVE